MAVKFYLSRRLSVAGDAPIRLSVSMLGIRLLTTIRLSVPPASWLPQRQRMRRSTANSRGISAATINAVLADVKTAFVRYENKCVLTGHLPTRHDLSRVLSQARHKTGDDTLLTSRLDEFIATESAAKSWTKGTAEKFCVLRKHLDSFDKTLTFSALDKEQMNKFTAYLLSQNLRNSTILKQLSLLKWYLRWAQEQGCDVQSQCLRFDPALKQVPHRVVSLEWTELLSMFTINLADVTMATVRDIFCFCAFTSLRFSDALNLKKSDISNGSLTITTIKTADTVTIELNRDASSICQRYMTGGDIYLFPRITCQHANRLLKKIAKACGLNTPVTLIYYQGGKRVERVQEKWRLVSTHTARRTFISTALMMGISPEIVMKWTGHCDYKSMRPYIDVCSSAKAAAMSLFDTR